MVPGVVRVLESNDVEENLEVDIDREKRLLLLLLEGEDDAEVCDGFPEVVAAEEIEVNEEDIARLVLVAEDKIRVNESLPLLATKDAVVGKAGEAEEPEEIRLVPEGIVGANTLGGPKGHADGLTCIVRWLSQNGVREACIYRIHLSTVISLPESLMRNLRTNTGNSSEIS